MYEWQKQIQTIVDEIDRCIKNYNDEALTLRFPDFYSCLNTKPCEAYIIKPLQGF